MIRYYLKEFYGFKNFGGGSKIFLSPMTPGFKVIPKNKNKFYLPKWCGLSVHFIAGFYPFTSYICTNATKTILTESQNRSTI